MFLRSARNMVIPEISTNELTSREVLYPSVALLIKHGVYYSLSVVNAARRSRFLAILFWHSNLRPQAVLGFSHAAWHSVGFANGFGVPVF
jgi:hypothetical protein